MKQLFLLLTLLIISSIGAQGQSKLPSLLYTNVTLHIGDGTVIENGVLGIRDGKIDLVGKSAGNQTYDQTIDGKGQHLYPGLIAPNTRLGLEEVEAVRATLDFQEVGRFNPNIRSIIAYNTDSDVIPTVRSNGVLLAQIVPQGGRISGQSSLAYTQADNWEDAAFELDNCVHLRWPTRIQYTGWWAQKGRTLGNKKYDRTVMAVQVYLDAAKAYAQKTSVEQKNLKFETLKEVFSGKKALVVHVEEARSILDAINLLENYKGVRLVIQGGAESWKVADFLKEKNIPVILNNLHALPRQEDADIDQSFKTPALLQSKGVKFAFAMTGSSNVRNLMFQAGQAVAYGLDKEAALRAMTLSTAEILGVDDRVGSLTKGKDATFIVVQGDVLDMRTSVVTAAYMAGRTVDLSDKQKELYQKYLEKYELEGK